VNPVSRTTPTGLAVLVAGVIIFLATLTAWLIAGHMGIDPGPLFYIAGPVIASLFVAPSLGKAADNAAQAATQTNGQLDARLEAAAGRALAKRDAARTRQAVGDVGIPGLSPEDGTATSPTGNTPA
jgi:hypothetical protein